MGEWKKDIKSNYFAFLLSSAILILSVGKSHPRVLHFENFLQVSHLRSHICVLQALGSTFEPFQPHLDHSNESFPAANDDGDGRQHETRLASKVLHGAAA